MTHWGWIRVAKRTLLKWHLCPVLTQGDHPVKAELVWTRLQLKGMAYAG
jgi:hypothetical protein